MEYMQACLAKYPHHQGIAVFHHQPIPVRSAWLDQYVLANASEFWRTVRDFPQLKTILFGHVHQVHEGQKQGVHYYSAPATCIQFMRNRNDFALENLNPGYRWLDLSPSGDFRTGIVRVPHYVGTFQANAKGYE
jgi:Icc protein